MRSLAVAGRSKSLQELCTSQLWTLSGARESRVWGGLGALRAVRLLSVPSSNGGRLLASPTATEQQGWLTDLPEGPASSPIAEMYHWDQPGEGSLEVLPSQEEQILNSTFEACDPQRTGIVAVTRVLAYLETVTGRGSQDARLQTLACSLDPNGEGPQATVDLDTFLVVMRDWIATCQLDGGLELEEEATLEETAQHLPSGFPEAEDTANLESFGGEDPRPELPAPADLLSSLEDLELSNRRLVGENAKLQRSVETAEEGSARLREEILALRKQLRSTQQALQLAKAMGEELEDLKTLAKSLEERNRSLLAQARQSEKEQQHLVAEMETLQEENGKLLVQQDGVKRRSAELATEKDALKVPSLPSALTTSHHSGLFSHLLFQLLQPSEDKGLPSNRQVPRATRQLCQNPSQCSQCPERPRRLKRGARKRSCLGRAGLQGKSRETRQMDRLLPWQRELYECERLICQRDADLSERTRHAESLAKTLEEYRATSQELRLEISHLEEQLSQTHQGPEEPPEGAHMRRVGWTRLPLPSLGVEIKAIQQKQEVAATSLSSPLCGFWQWEEATGETNAEAEFPSEAPAGAQRSFQGEPARPQEKRKTQSMWLPRREAEEEAESQFTANLPIPVGDPHTGDIPESPPESSPPELEMQQALVPVVKKLVLVRRPVWGQLCLHPLRPQQLRVTRHPRVPAPVLGLLLLALLSFLLLGQAPPTTWPHLQLCHLQPPPV
nr:protein KASH5 isoform X1 [Manis javanica]